MWEGEIMKPRVLINLWVVIVLALLVWSAVAPAGALAQEPDNGEDDEGDLGGYIELRVQPGLGELWTVVQWQDGVGWWHDVEGWRAQVGPDQAVTWWVAPRDLDTGPFRWLVYQEDHGRRGVVWASELFYLPKQAETLEVTTAVSVRPAPGHPDFKPMMPSEGRPPDPVMPERQRQPDPQMLDKQSQPNPPMPETQPESLMPEAGGSLGGLSRLITTAFSAIAALALVAGGLVAAFRNGLTI
jgi:hypothetical protein